MIIENAQEVNSDSGIEIEDFYDYYTPAPNHLVKKYSAGVALVWGRILRYQKIPKERGGKGYCCASIATIGKEIGMSARTVQRHIKLLMAGGYVEEIDPAPENKQLHRAHKLITTKKLQIRIKAIQTVEVGQEVGQNVLPRSDNLSRGGDNLSPKHIKESQDRANDLDSSNPLFSLLSKATEGTSKHEEFQKCLTKLEECGVTVEHLEAWLKDKVDGWPAEHHPEGAKPWPSQVTKLLIPYVHQVYDYEKQWRVVDA